MGTWHAGKILSRSSKRLAGLCARRRSLLLAVPVALACGSPPARAAPRPALPPVPTFTEVSKAAGIDFTYWWGDREMDNIVEGTGSGCTWLDYDGDGFVDLYLANGATTEGVSSLPRGQQAPRATNRLYRNNGNGTFSDVTEKAGVGDPRFSTAALAADYDNDGDTDLYVTNYGRNTLYRNAGNGTFSDVTEQAGVGDARWGMGGAWFDYDGDGDLDLYVVNYLEFDKKYRLYFEADGFPGPLAYPGVGDLLYRNEGNGSFSDVTAGIQGQRANKGRGMSAIAADFDEDGRPDLFVANDAMENYLLLNRGVREGRWVVEDAALLSGLAYSASGDAAASMGGDVGDVDGDGRLDLVVPDNAFNNVYLARGKGIFEDLTAALGVAEASGQFWSWGVDLLDLDNDGDLDLVFSNGHGHLVHETQEMLVLFQVRDAAGKPRFLDAGRAVGPFGTHKMIGRGLCTADYDNDGDLDLFVLALDQPSVLARNDSRPGNHWLAVQLRGRRSNRDGIGALVTVRAGKLARTELRFAGGSFVSQHDPRLHFGLGPETKVDVVEVRWPSGRVQQVERPPVDRLLLVQEPEP